jgi:hypothetical protein
MQQKGIAEINAPINKEWVLGCDRFKNKDKDKEATWQKTIAAWWQ